MDGDALPPGWTVTLDDGERVLLRPIQPDDKAELQRGFERLSRESRYKRFFSAVSRLTEKQLAYFTEIDYHDHFAWVALVTDREEARGVAVGRYIRLRDEPEAAEIALAVVDEYQGRGLGRHLLEALVETAYANGIRRIVGHVLADNRPMLALLEQAGGTASFEEPGLFRLDVELPEPGTPFPESDVYDALRKAARPDG
ncbi:MAG: GNAT family N-acetyltransferase [Acidimicrobiia bacterium]|nr:GNAT family N-acetyltransferase [Acidimicrobiia bacterium]